MDATIKTVLHYTIMSHETNSVYKQSIDIQSIASIKLRQLALILTQRNKASFIEYLVLMKIPIKLSIHTSLLEVLIVTFQPVVVGYSDRI